MNVDRTYRKSQVNGTVYFSTRRQPGGSLLKSLHEGAGEMFLTNIPIKATPEELLHVARELGEIYQLRFKIDFAGFSRGYAYLQYLDEHLMEHALVELPRDFRRHALPINVRASTNAKVLVLRNVQKLTPIQVYQELRSFGHFEKLRVHEWRPRHYIYIIIYRNNDVAATAHHNVRSSIRFFGGHAHITWLEKPVNFSDESGFPSRCCAQAAIRSSGQLLPLSNCKCFRM